MGDSYWIKVSVSSDILFVFVLFRGEGLVGSTRTVVPAVHPRKLRRHSYFSLPEPRRHGLD